MDGTPTLARRKFRRLFYVGAGATLVLIVVSLIIPAVLETRAELSLKISQLSESIIEQKKVFLRAIIVEKIGDIERIRTNLGESASSLDAEDFEIRFRTAVKELIHTTVLPDDGYIWINEIVDFDGGEAYAVRFAHPNLPETEGDYLSTYTTDIAGNLPYLEELEGVKAGGEVFFDYYFPKMNSDVISHKLSYARLYEPYSWIVASGVYLDDVDALVARESDKMRMSTTRTIRSIGITVLVTILVLLVVTVLFESRIQQFINVYTEALRTSNNELRKEKAKLENAVRQIEDIAYTDFLTGLWNRRAMMNRIRLEISRARREESTFGIVMCDIDHFKRINDTYGHEIGDCVLVDVARVLTQSIRAEDSCARWGGEEFLIMVINVDRDQVMAVAEKLRTTLEEHSITCNRQEIRITVTAGVSLFNRDADIDRVISAADGNLYRGKNAGRNIVVG